MESFSDPSMQYVRQGGVSDHLSAIGMHFRFLLSAMFGGGGGSLSPPAKVVAASSKGPLKVPRFIILPTGPRKQTWDVIIMLMIVYSALSIPVRIGFQAHAEGTMWTLEVAMSILFIIDVLFAFSTAYRDDDGMWVYDRALIARSYLLGWFWIDGPSSVPVELIELYLGTTDSSVHSLTGLRILRMFRLIRLLRLFKLQEYIQRFEEAFMINLRILKLFGIFGASSPQISPPTPLS